MKEYDIIFNNGRGSTLLSYIEATSEKEAIQEFKKKFAGELKGHRMVRCEEVVDLTRSSDDELANAERYYDI